MTNFFFGCTPDLSVWHLILKVMKAMKKAILGLFPMSQSFQQASHLLESLCKHCEYGKLSGAITPSLNSNFNICVSRGQNANIRSFFEIQFSTYSDITHVKQRQAECPLKVLQTYNRQSKTTSPITSKSYGNFRCHFFKKTSCIMFAF